MSVGDLRWAVLYRDGGCIAWAIDPDAGECFDRWGGIMADRFVPNLLEMDYVRLGARGKHHELEVDHVALCPGHHRGIGPQGGKVWATAHRKELREYLDRLYPKD